MKKVSYELLEKHDKALSELGYRPAKWTWLCRELLKCGYEVGLYEAKKTFSKYIHIKKNGKKFKVRISNHFPNKQKELAGDCDFFVGITHTGVRTTEDALAAIKDFFKQ